MSSPGLRLYGLATGLLEPAAPLLVRRRARRGHEDPERLDERLGRSGVARPPGPLAWLHGASVGESLSLLPLAERLRRARPDAGLLFTSGTRSAAEVMAARLPTGAAHQYAPIDTPGAVRRFLDHWRPSLGVFAESELWPNLLLAARARGVRLALVGARQSEASLGHWRRRAPAAARALLGVFDLILARDAEAARGLAGLGARIDGTADPKLAAPPLPVDEGERREFGRALAERPLILAASTHPGEEAIILAAWARVERRSRALLTIVPRHVERGADIERLARDRGFTSGRRSLGVDPTAVAVYVGDTLGELGLWCRLARLALLGGSLRPGFGGHNPLEPARLGCPVASGPFIDNWPIIGEMARQDALALVADEAAVADLFRAAVTDPGQLMAAARRARAFAAVREQATIAALDGVIALLPP